MKNVLVTGAAKRLGRAIVLDLAGAGWNVALHYHGSAEDAEKTAAEARALGVTVATFKADLSQEEETAALVARAGAGLGPLTALINSASLFEGDDWKSATRESWDAHMQTNLRAPLLLSQHFALALPDGEGILGGADAIVRDGFHDACLHCVMSCWRHSATSLR